MSMELLPITDEGWKRYRGGYKRAVVNLIPFLEKLGSGHMVEKDWDILWDDLHHQGDVGEASYAVVPYLAHYASIATPIAWHAFGFPAVVELERGRHGNPEVPPELFGNYTAALQALPKIALNRGPAVWGENCFEPIMACLALSLERPQHARAYLDLTEGEIPEFYKYYYEQSES
jgi:hypothetical protein